MFDLQFNAYESSLTCDKVSIFSSVKIRNDIGFEASKSHFPIEQLSKSSQQNKSFRIISLQDKFIIDRVCGTRDGNVLSCVCPSVHGVRGQMVQEGQVKDIS